MMTETETRPLKEARVGAGLGREKAAGMAGMSKALLYRYEVGQRRAGIVNATKIAHVLGVRVDEITEFAPLVREVEEAGFRLVLAEPGEHGNTE